jgi:hypothetical protein
MALYSNVVYFTFCWKKWKRRYAAWRYFFNVGDIHSLHRERKSEIKRRIRVYNEAPGFRPGPHTTRYKVFITTDEISLKVAAKRLAWDAQPKPAARCPHNAHCHERGNAIG